MQTPTQMLVGMATAGLVAGPHRPYALVAGAVAGVLPDVIDWWARQVFRRPDVVITPDPLAPDAPMIAQGVQVALRQVRESGRPCLLRLNPLPTTDGAFVAYDIDYTRDHDLVITLDLPGAARTARVPTPDAPTISFAPRHALPLRVRCETVDLLLSPAGARVESHDMAGDAGVGHSLVIGGALAALGATCDLRLGAAFGAAWVVHLLLDAGGRRRLAPWLPISSYRVQGRRCWNEQGWQANACAGLLATGALAAIMLAG